MARQKLLQAAKPILFNTEMVRAILDGRKTVRRRVIIPQPEKVIQRADKPIRPVLINAYNEMPKGIRYFLDDILYVRETFCQFYSEDVIDGAKYAYRADATSESEKVRKELGYKWKP